ncbi:FadR/GntR family transcriptional regulator [Brevibacterium casei]|uniref:FadR/GntR family transcriptional regulator n=1 Tax=Brevibacterium casei TaxID=33889 RepID=UPI00246894A7|nr:FCD domain-containing protein [Brevibacterium casei]MDH5148424.1 FCD domain-containing protein [Brevibacterium casei]
MTSEARALTTSPVDRAVALVSDRASRLEPGERLGTKSALQVECGVSKGTFNEALRLLQHRGIITLRPGPGGGLFAAEPTPMARLGNSLLALDADSTTVEDAMRVRDSLEPLLASDAVDHGSLKDVRDLWEHIGQMRAAVEAEDANRFLEANWGLHRRIAEITPNQLLRSIYLNLMAIIDDHTLDVLPVADTPLESFIAERLQLHIDIVEAIEARDRDRTAELMRVHAGG